MLMAHIDDLIKKAVKYYPQTGQFVWLARTPDMFQPSANLDPRYSVECRCKKYNTRYAGKIVRITLNAKGYATFRMFGKIRLAHRVAAFLMLGYWPRYIDHIDGVPSNNVWSNLRPVTQKINMRNQRKRSNNTSGVTGVYFAKHIGKYIASIRNNYKLIHLGVFDTIEAAAKARFDAEVRLGYTLRHGK